MIDNMPVIILDKTHFSDPDNQCAVADGKVDHSSPNSSDVDVELGTIENGAHSSSSQRLIELTCSICLNDLVIGEEAKILPCKHIFHKHVCIVIRTFLVNCLL